ncbi:TetR/AcrR family transcriptional regulator [Streptosporangium amethystogenes]|uniref:TetR/AcrR family transcriptional regulator n=1 Tax=Streptosporangium amethystogenes TaxID=2002 RepID=UPI0004C91374|nr:TetR/AcrR family transcriptional regulator [Streptosporangium amethystogenes]
MHNAEGSLRERNRLETWTAIHDTAARLSFEKGLAEATVEEIAAAAGVSRRTFFNYFPTKEDAVLGVRAPAVPAEALRDFRGGDDDLFGRTVSLLAAVVMSMTRGGSPRGRRLELIRRYPELRTRFHQYASAAEKLVEPILAERLAGAAARPAPEDSVAAMLALAGAVIRFAYARDPEMSAGTDVAIENALEIFRDVIRKNP